MRFFPTWLRLPRSLSARTLMGYAVLVLVFSGIAVTAVLTTENLKKEIRVIRVGYLELSLRSRDLAEKQQALYDYLRDDFDEASTPRGVNRKLKQLLSARQLLLDQIQQILNNLGEIPPSHAKLMGMTQTQLSELRGLVDGLSKKYDALLEMPPTERVRKDPAAFKTTAEVVAALQVTLREVMQTETRILNLATHLQTVQRNRVTDTARQLELGAYRMRTLTVWWGISAVILGLLFTAWAVLNLRPLKRLQAMATRIAQGHYGERIAEEGPHEVSDLAREFNTMSRAIEERERELVRTEQLATVGKMAAVVTHEVRNPLSSISLNTELLEEELQNLPQTSGGEARQLCEAIHKEVDRLTAITEEYLQFARWPKPNPSAIELADVIAEILDFERPNLVKRGLKVEIEATRPIPAFIDERQLRHALINLLLNSTFALQQTLDPKIIVRVWHDDATGHACIQISDNGPGIPEQVRAKLFEPFVTGKSGGTGLGLALVRQIVHDHSGTISVDSSAQGAVFVMRFPASQTRNTPAT